MCVHVCVIKIYGKWQHEYPMTQVSDFFTNLCLSVCIDFVFFNRRLLHKNQLKSMPLLLHYSKALDTA